MFDMINEVKQPQLLAITGVESLGLRESLSLFFNEFNRSIDRKMAGLKSSIHEIDYRSTQRYLETKNILFVRNAGVEITVPEYYSGAMGEMEAYVRHLINGLFVVNSLKTETTRLYDWLKNIVKRGRMDKSFSWAISDFDQCLEQTETFIKELDSNNKAKFPLDQVYLQFNDAFMLINQYNQAAKSLKARDIEILSRDITAVYDIGSLLVTKVENNDIVLDKESLVDIQLVINNYVNLVNVAGVITGLLNELTAVFEAQLSEFRKMK